MLLRSFFSNNKRLAMQLVAVDLELRLAITSYYLILPYISRLIDLSGQVIASTLV
jgi:hypothetical protein